jgi:hypothetical protein
MPFLAPLGAAAAGAASNSITPYLLSAGAGLLSGQGKKTTQGSSGTLAQVQPFSYAQKLDQTAADFFAGNYSRLGQGQAPAYIDRGLKISQDNMKRNLNEATYGYAGNRSSPGTVNAALTAGALTGTGERSAKSGVAKVLANYQTAASNIDAEIERMRMGSIETAIGQGTQAIAAIPHFPQTVAFGGYAPQQTEGISPYLSQMAGMLGYQQSQQGSGQPTSATTSTFKNKYQPGYGGGQSAYYGFTGQTSAAAPSYMQQLGQSISGANPWGVLGPVATAGQYVGNAAQYYGSNYDSWIQQLQAGLQSKG